MPLPPQATADSDAITFVQGLSAEIDPAAAISAKRPTLPGLTTPSVTAPAATQPAVTAPAPVMPPPMTRVPAAPEPPPVAVAGTTASGIAQPAIATPPAASPYTQWIIAGASFVVVLAVAGGFLIARIFESKEVAQVAPAPAGISVAASPSTTPPPAATAPPTESQPNVPFAGAAASRPAQPPVPPTTMKQREAPADPRATAATVAAPAPSADVAPAGANVSYRAAIAALEGSGWRYLDDQGRLTAGAEAAEPLFNHALSTEPGNVSAELHLAVIRLFRRRYDVAQKAIHPLLVSEGLTDTERLIASYAFSASAVAPSGNGIKEFETSLDKAIAYAGGNPQFAAFARDVRWLATRGSRR
jgi:hypothetical protein